MFQFYFIMYNKYLHERVFTKNTKITCTGRITVLGEALLQLFRNAPKGFIYCKFIIIFHFITSSSSV